MTRLTTRVTTTAAASGFLLFTLTACPGSEGGTGGGTCANYFDALVSYLDRCGDGSSSSAIASARARFENLRGNALAAPGTTNLAAQIDSCTRSVASVACGEEFDCIATTGSLDDGAPCAQGYQCKGGECKRATDANCGTCAARVAIGGDCTTSSRCVDGASCVTNGESRKCVPIRIAKAGETCIARSSDEVIRCDKGLNCSLTGSEATCKAPGAAGAVCKVRSDCADNLQCVKEQCAASLSEGADCIASECAKGLRCDSSTKKCARVISVKAGETCDQLHRCERGQCAGATASGQTAGKCVDPIPDGAACTSDGPPCDVFATCVAGKCTLPEPAQCK